MSTVTQRRTCRVQTADATPGGTERGTAGTPALVAYGYGWIAEQAGTTPGAVRSAAIRGQFDVAEDAIRSFQLTMDGVAGPDSNVHAFLQAPVMCGSVRVELVGDRVCFTGVWDA